MLTTIALAVAITAPAQLGAEQIQEGAWALDRDGENSILETRSTEGARLIYVCDPTGCGWAILLAPHSCKEGDLIPIRIASPKGSESAEARCKVANHELSSLAIQDYDTATRLISGAAEATFEIPTADGTGTVTFKTAGFNAARAKMGDK